jgi:hypothetical protein
MIEEFDAIYEFVTHTAHSLSQKGMALSTVECGGMLTKQLVG